MPKRKNLYSSEDQTANESTFLRQNPKIIHIVQRFTGTSEHLSMASQWSLFYSFVPEICSALFPACCNWLSSDSRLWHHHSQGLQWRGWHHHSQGLQRCSWHHHSPGLQRGGLQGRSLAGWAGVSASLTARLSPSPTGTPMTGATKAIWPRMAAAAKMVNFMFN